MHRHERVNTFLKETLITNKKGPKKKDFKKIFSLEILIPESIVCKIQEIFTFL